MKAAGRGGRISWWATPALVGAWLLVVGSGDAAAQTLEPRQGILTFGPEVVIGDREDHELDHPMFWLAINSRDHLIVATVGQVHEFDADGNFVREIARAGSAPEEFWLPRGVLLGPNDSLFLFHSGGVSVFDEEGTFVRRTPIRQPPLGPLPLESGEFVSHTAGGLSADGSSLYLHDAHWVRRTLGSASTALPAGSVLSGPIRTGPSSGSSFWVAGEAPYRLERWNVAGEVELVLEPSSDHFPDRKYTEVLDSGRSVTTTTPFVSAVAEDQEGRLWTAVAELLDDEVGAPPSNGPRFESVIEVRDSRTGDLIATGRTRGIVFSITPDGHLVARWQGLAEDGVVIVRRARLELDGEARQ